MKIETWIEAVVRNRYDNVISHTKRRANSYPRYIIDQMYAWLHASGETNGGLDTSNTARTLGYGVNPAMSAAAAVGDATMGIVVGTGTDAVSISDYKLATQIAHGNGAGQLYHNQVTFPVTPTLSGTTKYFTLQRSFVNNSGGSITVNEVGIYVDQGTSHWKFCLDRTLDTKTVPNGSTLTETYTIGVTV